MPQQRAGSISAGPTRRGGRWHVLTVTNLLDRLGGDGGGMYQSRRMSLVEALASVGICYAVAVLVQIVLFPVFCDRSGLHHCLVMRSYALRRAFEAL